MTTNLYNLPKDMLVKMISTIREDTKKEVREEMLEEVKGKIKKFFSINIVRCSEIECNNYDFCHYDREWKCSHSCGKMLCDNHRSIHELECRKKKEELNKISDTKSGGEQINVIHIEDGLYYDVDHGFIIRVGHDNYPIVVAIEENAIRRSLTDLEKEIALNLGMCVQER